MYTKIFKGKVVSKKEELQGLFFKSSKYFIVVEVNGLSPSIHKIEVPLEQYFRYKPNINYDITMYSENNINWRFDPYF